MGCRRGMSGVTAVGRRAPGFAEAFRRPTPRESICAILVLVQKRCWNGEGCLNCSRAVRRVVGGEMGNMRAGYLCQRPRP